MDEFFFNFVRKIGGGSNLIILEFTIYFTFLYGIAKSFTTQLKKLGIELGQNDDDQIIFTTFVKLRKKAVIYLDALIVFCFVAPTIFFSWQIPNLISETTSFESIGNEMKNNISYAILFLIFSIFILFKENSELFYKKLKYSYAAYKVK